MSTRQAREIRIKPAAMGMAFIMTKESTDSGIIDLIERTPETAAAGEMRALLEFACKYFRESYIVTDDSRHEPEYQMWQGFEKLLKRIAEQERKGAEDSEDADAFETIKGER